MNMVFYAADSIEITFVLLTNAVNVGIKLWLNGFYQ